MNAEAKLPQAVAPLARLLIVDDEEAQLRALCDTLKLEGFAPTGFSSPREALSKLQPDDFDLLLTDLMMPGMDGIELLQAAQRIDADLAAIVMTGHGTIDTAVKAMQAGALDYIRKPFRLNQMMPVIARALETRRLRRVNRELEQRVLERTRELEIANRDLEAFSFSVSHDLRAPLRIIQGFCELFIEDFGPQVPEDGRALLKRIEGGAQRMSRLIEDLLNFSRAGRRALELTRIAMSELVRSVVAELAEPSPSRQVQIEIADLPDAWGDPALIRQVLVNLLSNALKFTSTRPCARIELTSTDHEGQHVYRIADNGVGFDEAYAHKLFGVFQRLHSEEEFAGTGIGLSIVKRIIERHGGRIWAEGRLNEGATFSFILPAVKPEPRA
ncbi:MAG TPA: response regulator [Steroidobacteraceae bacterium]|nr:response regulator [Steroidobacteraceae bacterium]